MKIKRIKVENFKSFNRLEVDLRDFNIVIGANASGKSNFIHIFEFLRDIEKHGLENAISMQGGIEYLRNINTADNQNLSIEITTDSTGIGIMPIKSAGYTLRMERPEVTYRFVLGFLKRKPGFEIIEDELWGTIELSKLKNGREKPTTSTFKIRNHKGKLETKIDIPDGLDKDQIESSIFPFKDFFKQFPNKVLLGALLLETPFLRLPILLAYEFSALGVYNFNPRLLKQPIPVGGKADLEEDGSNLAIVLKNILSDKEEKRQFINLVTDLLSFVDDLGVESQNGSSLLVRLKEVYSKKEFLPAPCLSDGTLNLIALLIALYFEKKSPAIIEEPERNIHPHLISRTLQMMKEASRKKQIIVTTHNPELLKHADIEDLLFVSRDQEGYSRITRPSQSREIKIFIENEMGLDELYVQNLLEMARGE